MLAQLKAVVLIKEAVKLAFFRLVELQQLRVKLKTQNSLKKKKKFLLNLSLLLFWQMKAILFLHN